MIRYKDGYKYQLYEPYVLSVPGVPDATEAFLTVADGLLLIERGYAWDGPSGPTYDCPCAMRGSLVHDALYQLMRVGAVPESFRKYADELLYTMCIEDGMWKIRAKIWWAAVRLAGGLQVKKGADRRVLEAP